MFIKHKNYFLPITASDEGATPLSTSSTKCSILSMIKKPVKTDRIDTNVNYCTVES